MDDLEKKDSNVFLLYNSFAIVDAATTIVCTNNRKIYDNRMGEKER